MTVFIIYFPYDGYGQIYGVRSTLEKAIQLAYDAHCDWYRDEENSYGYPMKFSTWKKNKHWEDWIAEYEIDGESWIIEGNK